MNAELLYTSAPQGLKQGSRGFCTVQSTAGMPINLAMKLESLSGYRHLYPPGDSRASLNPVAWSHLKFSLGGRTVSVLSRIADYGLDYSQRTNKLAHHLVLDAPLPPAGPVTLIQQPGVLKTSWDGKCTTLPPPMIPGVSAPGPGVCRTWQRLTGDAGWAGMVAQHWMQPRAKPLHLIFAESQSGQLMQLLAESMALLPPSMLWEATFSTYVTSLPPDIDCKVRCLVAGSEEARAIAARHTVIDLTKPNPAAPSGPAVEAARAGRSIQTAAAPVIAKAPEPMLEQKLEDDFFVLPDQDDAELTLQPDRPPPVVAPKLPPSRTASLPPVASQEPHKEPRRSPIEDRARIATIVAACSVLLVLALGGLAAWRYQQALQVTQADIATGQQVNEWGLPESSEQKSEKPSEDGGPTEEFSNHRENETSQIPDNAGDGNKVEGGKPHEPDPEQLDNEKETGERDEATRPKLMPPQMSLVTCEVFAFPGGPRLSALLPGSQIRFKVEKPYEFAHIQLKYDSNQGKEVRLSKSQLDAQSGKWELEIGNEVALEPKVMIFADIEFKNCDPLLNYEIRETADVFVAEVDPRDALNETLNSDVQRILQKTKLRLLPPSNMSHSDGHLEWLCNNKALSDVSVLSTLWGADKFEFVKFLASQKINKRQKERSQYANLIIKRNKNFGPTAEFMQFVRDADVDSIKKYIQAPEKIDELYNNRISLDKAKKEYSDLLKDNPVNDEKLMKKKADVDRIEAERSALAALIPFDVETDRGQGLGIHDFWEKWNQEQKLLPKPKDIYREWVDDWRFIQDKIENQSPLQSDLFRVRPGGTTQRATPIQMWIRFSLKSVDGKIGGRPGGPGTKDAGFQ